MSSGGRLPDFKALTTQVQDSIADWDNSQESLASTLTQALRDVINNVGPVHMILVCVFETLITSTLESQSVVTFYDRLVDGLEEEGRENKINLLTEALADGVETVNEESYKDSLARRSDVDSNAADKSIEVLAGLLVRLPSVSSVFINRH